MKPKETYDERMPDRGATGLAWLMALVASGLVFATAALAFDLHNQKRRLETFGGHLNRVQATREAESKSLEARSKTGEAALSRLNAVQTDVESDLKRLGEAYAQREPVVKQSNELQAKIQAVANDLLDLAKTDPDARAITRKYNIQQPAAPSGGAPKP